MKEPINPFEHLRHHGVPDSDFIRNNYTTITVYDDRNEIINILVANAGNGRFAFGYNIYFLNGRHADRLPSLEFGYCDSEKNAILYFLGYISKYASMFSDNAIHEVNRLIGKYSQQSLF